MTISSGIYWTILTLYRIDRFITVYHLLNFNPCVDVTSVLCSDTLVSSGTEVWAKAYSLLIHADASLSLSRLSGP